MTGGLSALTSEESMKIYVSRVPAEGIKQEARYDPGELDMERIDVHLREPFAVDAFVMKADHELIVNAAIHCPLQLTCARCLEEFPRIVTTDAVLSYKVQPADVVDITEDIRQEIVLAYPMIPVCRPDCKGLCSVCGQNLNAGPCQHHPITQGS